MGLYASGKRESGHTLVPDMCQGYNIFYLTYTHHCPKGSSYPHSTLDKTGVQWNWIMHHLSHSWKSNLGPSGSMLYGLSSMPAPIGPRFWDRGSEISPSTSVVVAVVLLTIIWWWPLWLACLPFALQRFPVSFPSKHLNAFKFTSEIHPSGC